MDELEVGGLHTLKNADEAAKGTGGIADAGFDELELPEVPEFGELDSFAKAAAPADMELGDIKGLDVPDLSSEAPDTETVQTIDGMEALGEDITELPVIDDMAPLPDPGKPVYYKRDIEQPASVNSSQSQPSQGTYGSKAQNTPFTYEQNVTPYRQSNNGRNVLDIMEEERTELREKGRKKIAIIGIVGFLSYGADIITYISSIRAQGPGLTNVLGLAFDVVLVFLLYRLVRGSGSSRQILGRLSAIDFAIGLIGLFGLIAMSGLIGSLFGSTLSGLLIFLSIVGVTGNGVLAYLLNFDDTVIEYCKQMD